MLEILSLGIVLGIALVKCSSAISKALQTM
jgi:hypothetical protein